MTDFNLARGKSEPINRFGADNVTFEASEGDFVTVQDDGTGTIEVVLADATNGPATGLCFAEVTDPATLSNALDNLEHDLAHINDYTLVGDRLAFITHGVEIVNDDGDTAYTPGDPVYLAEGGGLTQTAPATAGSVVQVLGVALGPNDRGSRDGGGGKDRVAVDVQPHYTTV